MEYRYLGKTGVHVSELCFGTLAFGTVVDEDTAAALFQHCRDVGINFFDCADTYSGGCSEELLGKLIRGCRDEVVITSKVFWPMGTDVNSRGLSRRHIMEAVEASLKRLNTDYIDIYFLHDFDTRTQLHQSLRALDDLVRQGKVLYTGCSNFAAWQTARALGICEREGWESFDVIEPMYNLVKRQAEVEIFPLAQYENLGAITYSPAGGGLLTGEYGPDRRPDHGRLVENDAYAARYGELWHYETAERFTAFAREGGYEPTGLALAWAAAHPAVTAPIIGAYTKAELDKYLTALDIKMTPELRKEISALSQEPPQPTDRTEMRLPKWHGIR